MGDISVIIPAYNAEKTMGRALASLISSKDYIAEVIVVNDGSTDKTLERALEFKPFLNISIMTTANNGPGAARADGIRLATGKWITFLDADDCLTASSLRYVSEYLNDDLAVLHTKTIYYESGNFVSENIEYSDGSCGGNFYRLEYLLKHRLVPMIYPRLSEDEFFNSVVFTYTDAIDGGERRAYYDYPVYEVHHDFDDGLSYALDNWREYVIDARLQGAILLADFYHGYDAAAEHVKNEFLNTFCFSMVMWYGLMQDETFSFKDGELGKTFDAFRNARESYFEHFGGTDEDFFNCYNENKDMFYEGARASSGFAFKEFIQIEDFFSLLKGEDIV